MDESLILKKIKELTRRYRITTGWLTISRFLLISCLISAGFLFLSKITGFYTRQITSVLFLLPLAVLTGCISGSLKPISQLEVALKCDEKLSLKEKLSTALEWILDKSRMRTPMFRGLLRDTAKTVENIVPAKVFTFEWKYPVKRLSAVSLILVFLIWIPPLNLFTGRSNPRDVAVINREAEKVEKKAEELLKKPGINPKNDKKLQKIGTSMNKLSQDMKQPDIQKREVLSKISRIQDELNKSLANKEKMEEMQETLRKSLDNTKGPVSDSGEKTLDKLAESLKKASQQAQSPELTEQQKQALLDELRQMKDAMQKAGMNTQDIEKSMDSLRQNLNQKASSDLEKAAKDISGVSSEMEMMEALEDASKELESVRSSIASGNEPGTSSKSGGYKESDKQGPSDFGKGSTNVKTPGENETEKNDLYTKRFDPNSKSTWKESYEKLYDPERTKSESYVTGVKGTITKGPSIRTIRSEVRGKPGTEERSRTSVTDRYLEYRTQGEEAVKREKIPNRYRNLVRDYYNDIKPETD